MNLKKKGRETDINALIRYSACGVFSCIKFSVSSSIFFKFIAIDDGWFYQWKHRAHYHLKQSFLQHPINRLSNKWSSFFSIKIQLAPEYRTPIANKLSSNLLKAIFKNSEKIWILCSSKLIFKFLINNFVSFRFYILELH